MSFTPISLLTPVWAFVYMYRVPVTLIVVYIFGELIFAQIKTYRKKHYIIAHDDDDASSEQYLLYFQKKQYINIARVVLILVLLGAYLAWRNIFLFSGLGIAAWAIVLTFGRYLTGLFNFLQILPVFKIGQTIKVDDMMGEIISIKPLEMTLSGKNERWEHNGMNYQIPLYMFSEKVIIRYDLSVNAIMKTILRIPYNATLFQIRFSEFIQRLETYLDPKFTKNTHKTAGNYESYIGHKYKYNLEYLDDGTIIMFLWFLGTRNDNRLITREILLFVESMKTLSLPHRHETVSSV